MEEDKVTICVVNYKTLDLTRLCLRSIRKYTSYPYKVVVVDNDSQDESTEYLKSLPWIQLIERKDKAGHSIGSYAHAAALDMGFERCDTKYFMTMHSDVLIHKPGWLGELMQYFKDDPEIVCVGGGKCELTTPFRKYLKKISDFKTLKRKWLRVPDPLGVHRYYNRAVCSIYRTYILKKEGLSFLMDRDKGLTVGKKLYFGLVDGGYPTVELTDRVMRGYLWHLAHATQVLNPDEYNLADRTMRKTQRLLESIMNSKQVREIVTNSSLDQ